MKRSYLYILIAVLGFGFFIIYLAFLIPAEKELGYYLVDKCDNNSNSIIQKAIGQNKIQVKDGEMTLDSDIVKLLNEFNYCQLPQLQKDLDYLIDSLNCSESVVDELFAIYTDSLSDYYVLDTTELNSNNLMELIILGERANYYCEINDKYKYFYRGIGRFWLDKVSSHIVKLNKGKSKLKYDPNFKILVNRCAQNNYHIELKYNNTEKIANYLVEKRFSYILGRLWNGTSMWFKLLLFICTIGTLSAYYLLIKRIIYFIKNRK